MFCDKKSFRIFYIFAYLLCSKNSKIHFRKTSGMIVCRKLPDPSLNRNFVYTYIYIIYNIYNIYNTYIYINTKLPLNAIVRNVLRTRFQKQTPNYDTECSNHHPSLSTRSSKGLSRSKMKWWAIYTHIYPMQHSFQGEKTKCYLFYFCCCMLFLIFLNMRPYVI